MFAIFLLAALQANPAIDTVRYAASFPNAVHREAEVTVTFPAGSHDTLEVRMSRSSPGRYAIHEFAKNVYNVRATDGAGRAVTVIRPDPYRWLVTDHNGVVNFSYTLFADRGDGTYAQIDPSHAHLNMPATFAWAHGLESNPIAISFAPPTGSGWKVASQLVPTRDPMTFAAPDLQYFLDSPTELSDHSLRTWTVTGPADRVDTIKLAVHHLGTEAEVDAYAEMARKVVAEQIGIFGETSRYDHGSYVFIADYLPWASGDGMEHRNSTILSSTASLEQNAAGLLGTLSHEFFHSWNVERIRPADLEPFDFFNANATDALWFAEGFTSYYTPLAIRRGGLMTDAQYAASLGGTLNAVINAPGRRFFSPMEMSLQAPFVDAATSVDPVNRGNTFLSYYTWGAAIGAGLDLSLRDRFTDHTLDGYMRFMWQRHGAGGQYEVPRPYTVDDLEQGLADYTDDAEFARQFFADYIRGRDVVDYAALLERAGMVLRPANAERGYIGQVQLEFTDAGAEVQSGTTLGTPLYEAGIDRGAVITAVNGAVPTRESWRALLERTPGDSATISFTQRGKQSEVQLRFGSDPRLQVVLLEDAGGTPTSAQLAFRADWLSSKAP